MTIYHCRTRFMQVTDHVGEIRRKLRRLKPHSATGAVSSVILLSFPSTEGLPDSLLEEFDPGGGICLLRSAPQGAVSSGCRRYQHA